MKRTDIENKIIDIMVELNAVNVSKKTSSELIQAELLKDSNFQSYIYWEIIAPALSNLEKSNCIIKDHGWHLGVDEDDVDLVNESQGCIACGNDTKEENLKVCDKCASEYKF